jgi:hypothetical protein
MTNPSLNEQRSVKGKVAGGSGNLRSDIPHNFTPSLFNFIFIFNGSTALVVHLGLLIVEVSKSHSDTRTTFSRTPLDKRSTRLRDLYLTTQKRNSQETDMDAHGMIRTRNPSKQAATDSSLRPRGHRDRLIILLFIILSLYLAPQPNTGYGLLVHEVY